MKEKKYPLINGTRFRYIKKGGFFGIGCCYQMIEDATIQTEIYPEEDIRGWCWNLKMNGELTLEAYFTWDGASGPTWDTPSCKRGSGFHDSLFEAFRKELLDVIKWFKPSNELIRDLCIDDDMWKWRANGWYKGLSIGSHSAANPKNKKKVYEIV